MREMNEVEGSEEPESSNSPPSEQSESVGNDRLPDIQPSRKQKKGKKKRKGKLESDSDDGFGQQPEQFNSQLDDDDFENGLRDDPQDEENGNVKVTKYGKVIKKQKKKKKKRPNLEDGGDQFTGDGGGGFFGEPQY